MFSSLFLFFTADDNDDSFRYALDVTAWNHWHHCYMRALAADECIHTPCLSYSWNASDDELIMPYLLSRGCDCLVAYFPYLSGLSAYRSIAHGVLKRFGSLLSLSGLPLRQCCLMFHRGLGVGPESIYSTHRTVTTFIWNSFSRGSDHITLYISDYPSVVLRVSRVTCDNIEYTCMYMLVPFVRLVSTKPNGPWCY